MVLQRFRTANGITVHIYDDGGREIRGARRVLVYVPEDNYIHTHWLESGENDPGDVARGRTVIWEIKPAATVEEIEQFVLANEADFVGVRERFDRLEVVDGHKHARWAPDTPEVVARLTAAADRDLPAGAALAAQPARG